MSVTPVCYGLNLSLDLSEVNGYKWVMAWKPQKKRDWPWREYLTKEEAAEMAEIDRMAAEAQAIRREIGPRRIMIVNRAINRCKYALGQSASQRQ